MKFNEVFSVLRQMNIPVAYDHFDSPPSIPFITYSDSGSNHVYADNSVYKRALYVEIELYTDKKDLSKYYIISTKLPLKNFNGAIQQIIKNAILK